MSRHKSQLHLATIATCRAKVFQPGEKTDIFVRFSTVAGNKGSPDLVHAAKQEPDRSFPQAQTAHDNFWDFISLMPEAMHMVMWTMSDRAIPQGFRFMEGSGVHTFRLTDESGRSTYVKCHSKPKLVMQSVTWDEVVKMYGADPDFHCRDLWNSIETGDFPEWTMVVQLFDDAFADQSSLGLVAVSASRAESFLSERRATSQDCRE